MPHDGQVVRDEDVRQVELALQVFQQVDDLGLDGYVQRRNRLVADDELRPQRDRARDADALSLATGELVRVPVVVLGVEADALHERLHVGLDAVLGLDPLDPEGRPDDRADRVPRVQRRVRILEDHLNVAPEPAKPRPASVG